MTDEGDASAPVPQAAFSIDVEDWFHSENVKAAVPRDRWDGSVSRVERNTMRMLEILDEKGVRATFFVLGWVAERRPGIVRAVVDGGHELASHGFGHELVYTLSEAAFRNDVARRAPCSRTFPVSGCAAIAQPASRSPTGRSACSARKATPTTAR